MHHNLNKHGTLKLSGGSIELNFDPVSLRPAFPNPLLQRHLCYGFLSPQVQNAYLIAFAILSGPPARSAGMNDCVSRVCVIMGWEWDGVGIGMAIPGKAACKAGIGDPWEGCL